MKRIAAYTLFILIGWASVVIAGPTTVEDTQILIGNGGWLVAAYPNGVDSVSWQHQMDLTQFQTIDSANLTIVGIDVVDSAIVDVQFNSELLGSINLAGDFQETLNIPTHLLNQPLDAMATLKFQWSSSEPQWKFWKDPVDSVVLLSSTLAVTGTPVPVPGAILLSSMGIVGVQVLRSRSRRIL